MLAPDSVWLPPEIASEPPARGARPLVRQVAYVVARAHKADEWIGREELAQCDAMLARLADIIRSPAADWIRSEPRGA